MIIVLIEAKWKQISSLEIALSKDSTIPFTSLSPDGETRGFHVVAATHSASFKFPTVLIWIWKKKVSFDSKAIKVTLVIYLGWWVFSHCVVATISPPLIFSYCTYLWGMISYSKPWVTMSFAFPQKKWTTQAGDLYQQTLLNWLK